MALNVLVRRLHYWVSICIAFPALILIGSGLLLAMLSVFVAALLPADAAVNELDALGEPIVRLPEDAPMRRTLEATLASLDGGL